MRQKEREKWMALLEAERREHREEVAKLLDRIQHPEVRQVEAFTPLPPHIPEDFAELAHVGNEVPDYVNVGSADQIIAEEAEIARVGTIEEDS